MQVIRVRHDLHPANKALLAALEWDYVVDPDAPMCVHFVNNSNEIRVSDTPCERCIEAEKRTA
jgi:hypothetical protein